MQANTAQLPMPRNLNRCHADLALLGNHSQLQARLRACALRAHFEPRHVAVSPARLALSRTFLAMLSALLAQLASTAMLLLPPLRQRRVLVFRADLDDTKTWQAKRAVRSAQLVNTAIETYHPCLLKFEHARAVPRASSKTAVDKSVASRRKHARLDRVNLPVVVQQLIETAAAVLLF